MVEFNGWLFDFEGMIAVKVGEHEPAAKHYGNLPSWYEPKPPPDPDCRYLMVLNDSVYVSKDGISWHYMFLCGPFEGQGPVNKALYEAYEHWIVESTILNADVAE